jgi:hypothetical protein
LFDTGLLKFKAGIANSAILLKTDYQFKGALVENFVLQQLKDCFDLSPRYYSTRYGEIDFVIQNCSNIVPIEVKAGNNKSAITFKKYIKEKNPEIAIRFSEMNYVTDGKITNIPLYLAGSLNRLI